MTSEKNLNNGVVKSVPPKKKRRKASSLDRRKARSGWFFVLPFILGFVLIYLPIITDSIWLTFNKMTFLKGGGYELEFVAFNNYSEALFVNAGYVQTLIAGLKDFVFDIPAIVIFSLFMAVLLNQKMFGRGFFRAILFVPVILSTGVMDTIANADPMQMDGSIDDGSGTSASDQLISAMDIQFLFSNMKVGTELVEYVATMISDIYGIANRSGVQMLIFLSGLQSISPAIYESCSIDGATAWETFWKITLPMISPMILVNTVYTIIDAFTKDNMVMDFISNEREKVGAAVGSAMSWMYFLIVILILAAVAGLFSGFVFYQKRD